jgi:hypothetical protein
MIARDVVSSKPLPTANEVMERLAFAEAKKTSDELRLKKGVDARLFRRRRFFKVFTTICVLGVAMAYVPIADAHSPNSGDHAQRARRMTFDGRWSVVIETKRGACDSYRVGLDIVNGTVTYDGNPYGRVSASGLIRVSGAMGGQQAQGAGRLSRTSGQGVWHALVNTGVCDGHWMAERRD